MKLRIVIAIALIAGVQQLSAMQSSARALMQQLKDRINYLPLSAAQRTHFTLSLEYAAKDLAKSNNLIPALKELESQVIDSAQRDAKALLDREFLIIQGQDKAAQARGGGLITGALAGGVAGYALSKNTGEGAESSYSPSLVGE